MARYGLKINWDHDLPEVEVSAPSVRIYCIPFDRW